MASVATRVKKVVSKILKVDVGRVETGQQLPDICCLQ
jgi:hypothetical protein